MALDLNSMHRFKPFNFDGMTQRGEGAVADEVANLLSSDLYSPRDSLISRLRPKLLMQVPELFIDDTAEDAEFIVDDGPAFRVEVEVPMHDPCDLAPLIHLPEVPDWVEFKWDQEGGFVRVIAVTRDLTIEEAFSTLYRALFDYGRNIERTAQQIERFNAALPYLISCFIQNRVHEIWGDGGSTHPPKTVQGSRDLMDEAIVEAEVVTIYEVDHETGRPRRPV